MPRPSRLSALPRHVDPDGGPRSLTGRALLQAMRRLVRPGAAVQIELFGKGHCLQFVVRGEYRIDRRATDQFSEPAFDKAVVGDVDPHR